MTKRRSIFKTSLNPLAVWIGSLLVFFLLIVFIVYLADNSGGKDPLTTPLGMIILVSLVIDILVGIIAFLLVCVRLLRNLFFSKTKGGKKPRVFLDTTFSYLKTITILILLVFVGMLIGQKTGLIAGLKDTKHTVFNPSPFVLPSNQSTPQISIKSANPDPIVNCGPGRTSGQYVKDKQSRCKDYVDCGLNGNTVWTMMLKSECDKKHAEQVAKNNQAKGSSNSGPTIKCSLSYGTFDLTQKNCDWLKARDWNTGTNAPQNSPSSVVIDPYIQQLLEEDYQRYLEEQRQKEFENNQSMHGICVRSAEDWYANQGSQYGGSTQQAIKQLAYPEYQRKLAECDQLYPIR